MKKIHIFGIDIEKIENLKCKLEKYDFIYSEDSPELVICYGGDGIFLIAERVFPGIPKIFIKGSKVSNKGYDIKVEEVIERYLRKEFTIQNLKKIKATCKGRFETKELIGVNDIVIRNILPTEAIRFKVWINNKEIESRLGEFIGDGVVVSTVYGSSKGAYFYSITKESFDKGIGLAFNNITEKKEMQIVSDGKIEIEIVRGPGVLVADNNRDFINLEKGDKILIEEVDSYAKRIVLNHV